MRFLPAAAFLFLRTVLLPVPAQADDDGVYGRFDGDVSLAMGAGGGLMRTSGATAGVFMGELRLLFFDAAGPVVSAVIGPDADELLVLGVEMRPFFPAFFLEDLSLGHEYADLLIQSVGVELGAALVPQGSGTGVGWVAGLGLEVPLVLPSTFGHGVFLHIAVHRVRASLRDQAGPSRSAGGWRAAMMLTVKAIFGDVVSSWELPRYRP